MRSRQSQPAFVLRCTNTATYLCPQDEVLSERPRPRTPEQHRGRSYESKYFGVAALCVLLLAATGTAQTVTVREVEEVIPTYEAGPPDPNPMFYFGRVSQGAEGRTYPYPLYDNLTNRKVNKTYRLVYLENEYLKVGIAPEIGGRIFSGVDKTNGYNFFYRQHVIKPALIGLIGAWISGGVEWNIPHHHRASTFLPVQYRIETGADGSRTVWVGELELRHRMRWAVGYTLRPGVSYLEVAVRILNRTPLVQSMLAFANVAVNANEHYQIIFPPSTEYVTHHHKREFTTWPLATTPYGGVDWKGQDVSWYKNHIEANSMFAWNYWDDFFAGYDHGARAGTMSIADHHAVPGKKFWTWGNGPRGRMWDRILTDEDGPYVELMVGAYSDNQPDYSWLQPYDSRVVTIYWYPFRDIGGVKQANLQAAANLDVAADGARARVGFCTTAPHANATATLTVKGQALLSERIAIGPEAPFVRDVALPPGTDPRDVRVALAEDGRELVAYAPQPKRGDPMPAPVDPPPAPAAFRTVEELLLAGQRADQFHSPTLEPDPFWQEALGRDPGDARVNTAFGVVKLKRMQFTEAEAHLRAAIARLEFPHTSPKDGEPYYYLGLALKAQGRQDEAYDAFYKATWNGEWKAPAYFELAQIASRRGEFASARDHLERSLAHNALNPRARNLLTAVARRSGAPAPVFAAAPAAVPDPLDVTALAERAYAGDNTAAAQLDATLRDHPHAGLETAVDYAAAGLSQEAAAVLDRLAALAREPAAVDPLVHYYRADIAERAGDSGQAAASRAAARRVSLDYAFPFQAEAIPVLERAMSADARDARAPYLLGTLLFDHQPERAAALWEKAVQIDHALSVALRNLALAHARRGTRADVEQAIALLERAVQTGRATPVHVFELDQLYESSGAPVEKRLAMIEAHRPAVVARDDATVSYAGLLTSAGRPDEALALLANRVFNIWEGGARFSAGDAWTNAQLARGRELLAGRRRREALASFQKALDVPESLRAERREGTGGRTAEVRYWIGEAQQGLGRRAAAQESWQAAASAALPQSRRGGNDASVDRSVQEYYQALALRRVGEAPRAEAALRNVLVRGTAALRDAPNEIDFFSSFGEQRPDRRRVADAHYVVGLGRLGLNDEAAARAAFESALAASPDHLGARQELDAIGRPTR
jgi:tetratricopeptide (TPR) repeat protein